MKGFYILKNSISIDFKTIIKIVNIYKRDVNKT